LASPPPPGNQEMQIMLPTAGVFSYLSVGAVADIANLNTAAATTTLTELNFDDAVPVWISLPANTGRGLPGIDLSLSDLLINTSAPLCSAITSVDTVGTSCRPYAESPLTLNQHSGSVVAVLNANGNAYYVGGTPSTGTSYSGKISLVSTGADGTISGWLSAFDTSGSITAGYGAEFATAPEPKTLPILGVALFGIFLISRKKRSAA
jgi:hypothetical protein